MNKKLSIFWMGMLDFCLFDKMLLLFKQLCQELLPKYPQLVCDYISYYYETWVVNSLMQNIDSLNNNSILIAATNHHELLDPAIWRRFSKVMTLEKPQKDEISRLLVLLLIGYPCDFQNNDKKMELRNGVETIPSLLKNVYDVNKMRVHGKLRCKFFFGSKIAASNFRKLFHY